jgi:hypothetical protein
MSLGCVLYCHLQRGSAAGLLLEEALPDRPPAENLTRRKDVIC